MPTPNQLSRVDEPKYSAAADLLEVPKGNITREALINNISIGIQYIASWLCGNGCVPLYNLMEDAATAEISRVQVWQWLHHEVKVDNLKTINRGMFKQSISSAMMEIKEEVGEEKFENNKYREAALLFEQQVLASDLPDFLTLLAYEHII